MKVVIDTNSLISLVRYYLPFDKNGVMFNFVRAKITKSARLPYKTDTLIAPAPAKFLRQVENQFVNEVIRKKLSEVQFENQKNQFLENADMKQIILCLNLKDKEEDVILVTEETESSNDNKLFKKMPAICRELEIKTITLPELIEKYEGIDIDFQ